MKWTLILIAGALLAMFAGNASAYDCSNPDPDWILCENWDIGTPPANFPCYESECGNDHTWRGWYEGDTSHQEEGRATGLSTSITHSGIRSMHVVRLAGEERSKDLYHTISPSPSKVYIRWYQYFSSNWNSFGTQGSEFIHMIFTNSARSGTGWRINLRHHVGNDYPYTCEGGMFMAFQDNSNELGPWSGGCFNIKSHLNEWIAFEVMADTASNRISFWINGQQYLNNVPMSISQSNFNTIILSGWSSSKTFYTGDYYIDDIVVSNSYVGLAEEGPTTCPDGSCTSGETCAADSCCNGQTYTGAQVCCSGSIYTGDCCTNSDCSGSDTCQSHVCTAPAVECNDGIDNDGDGATDLSDSGCSGPSDNDESNCGDSECEGTETCSSCPGDCPTGAGQVCCSGSIYTGDCCSTSDCSGSDTCVSHVCTTPPVTCPNTICDSGETCSTCPQDCLDTGEVCCSGIAYTGDCCSTSDCSGSDACISHACTASSAVCGDDNCDPGESCSSCPGDCGACGGAITAEFGDATNSDHLGTVEDTFLNQGSDWGDIISNDDVELKTYTWPTNVIANNILMRFDLSAIPSSATVTSAELQLYQFDADASADDSYRLTVHKVINHNPVFSEANGYYYSASNPWTAVNYDGTYYYSDLGYLCCNENTPMAMNDISAAEDTVYADRTSGYKSWSVTSMVQDWVSSPSTNYGLLIVAEDNTAQNSFRYFRSSEYTDATTRPKLIVTYSTGSASGCSAADTSGNGAVEMAELMSRIAAWKAGSVTMNSLMSAIGEWVNGC
jgi:hypothetical protein